MKINEVIKEGTTNEAVNWLGAAMAGIPGVGNAGASIGAAKAAKLGDLGGSHGRILGMLKKGMNQNQIIQDLESNGINRKDAQEAVKDAAYEFRTNVAYKASQAQQQINREINKDVDKDAMMYKAGKIGTPQTQPASTPATANPSVIQPNPARTAPAPTTQAQPPAPTTQAPQSPTAPVVTTDASGKTIYSWKQPALEPDAPAPVNAKAKIARMPDGSIKVTDKNGANWTKPANPDQDYWRDDRTGSIFRPGSEQYTKLTAFNKNLKEAKK